MAQGHLIAIVDDDAGIRAGLSSLARSAGFAVRLFATAEEFLSDEEGPSADCVVTDVQMPGMSGLELQDLLRKGSPQVPVVVMTAFPTAAIRERALAAGATCFLSKPFDAEAILACLRRAIAGTPEG